MTNLKPCPFCGGSRIVVGPCELRNDFHEAACVDCGAKGPDATNEADALRLWSQRVPINPETGEPYFKVSREGWGEGWEGGPVFTPRIEK